MSRVTKRTKFSYKISFLFIFALLLQTGVSSAQTAESSSATETQAEQNTTDKKDSEDSKKKKSEEDTKKTTESQETKEENSASTTEANSESVNSSQPTVESSTPAATAPKASAGAQDSDALIEEENVTSSRLKKMDISGASPEMTFSGGDISNSGYNSISDLLRDSPISSMGAGRESSGSTRAGMSEVDIRGMGSDNTLVLLNGIRLAPIAGADSVNINRIPKEMIKEIKIIKDDLSSIYGSDAIGGVVNIITHESYNNFSVSGGATYTHLGGGERYNLDILGGKSTSKTNYVYSLSFRKNEPIYSKDRKWSNNGLSTIGSPGSYQNSGESIWHAAPDCPPDMIRPLPNGTTYCMFNASDYSTSKPLIEQSSAFLRAEHKLTKSVSVYTELLYSSLNTFYVYAPTPGAFTVPGSVADTYGLPNHIPGSDLEVLYRTVELGNRDTNQREDFYNISTGLKWDFLDTWSGQFSMTYGHENKKDKNKGNSIVADLESLLVQPTGGGYAFMPFNPAGSRGDLSSAYYEPWAKEIANFFMTDLRLEGEAFQIFNRPVMLTVGQSYVFRDYENIVDGPSERGEILSGAGSSGQAQRYFHSTYAQLEANLTSKLDLFLAGRYDKFSDFGDTFNPKIGIRYKLANDLMFRTTVGTGFKAPALSSLYASNSDSFRRFVDHVACANEGGGSNPSCQPMQYRVLSEGNPDLGEITSFSYNSGLVYSPSTNFDVSLDFWSINQKGMTWAPGDGALDSVTRAELAGIDVSALGIEMNRDASGYLNSSNPIKAPILDISERKTAGLDLEMSYTLPLSIGALEFSEMFSYRLWDISTVFPGLPDRDYVKDHWVNRWRNFFSVGYKLLDHRLGITIVSTDKYLNAVQNGFVEGYSRFDLSYRYTGVQNLEFSAGVQNFLGTTPPLDKTNPQEPMNTSLYSEDGPLVFTNVKYTF